MLVHDVGVCEKELNLVFQKLVQKIKSDFLKNFLRGRK